MNAGPGKYDELCTYVRNVTNAHGVVVIIAGGERGSGFSVQSTHPQFQFTLPQILRHVADQIEADNRAMRD